ncbi:glycosyltransferase family A protein [Romboutsia sp.]|uniref:glycosyltransferase family A protein n=1 Tax=Romboutsia sp. TaxID=1965302 RepID=UPI002B6F9043|nr:glycosyltransferase family A protein [Romboutsia sp.]HSQ87299.1 glycosyltransferase family A protein [Romboutsia sp.]
MNLQVLISTMNRKSIDELNILGKNINPSTSCVITNQTDNENKESIDNIKMINYNEIGIARNRNRSLQNASEDICILSDDDVEYVKDFEKIIEQAFIDNPDADIITFQAMTPQGEMFKNYRNEEFEHNKMTILRTSTIEIAFKLKSIKNNNIKFDNEFGLGSTYASGEENIFLMDCLNKGLKIKYIPKVIVLHEKESSGKILNEAAIYSKGPLFYRLFGPISVFLNFAFIIKKLPIIRFNRFKAIKLIYKGMLDYIKLNNR